MVAIAEANFCPDGNLRQRPLGWVVAGGGSPDCCAALIELITSNDIVRNIPMHAEYGRNRNLRSDYSLARGNCRQIQKCLKQLRNTMSYVSDSKEKGLHDDAKANKDFAEYII